MSENIMTNEYPSIALQSVSGGTPEFTAPTLTLLGNTSLLGSDRVYGMCATTDRLAVPIYGSR